MAGSIITAAKLRTIWFYHVGVGPPSPWFPDVATQHGCQVGRFGVVGSDGCLKQLVQLVSKPERWLGG